MKVFQTSREIPATPEQIFQAFSDSKILSKWWGPKGFTNTFHTFEFTKDGQWSFTMHGPDGQNYPNEGKFIDIQPSQQISIQHISEPRFVLTVLLTPNNRGTLLHWSQAFENEDVAKKVEHIVVPSNEQNIDRLMSEVLKNSSQIDSVGKTSLLVAAMRARETNNTKPEDRLFQDPYAEKLAGPIGAELLERALIESGDQPAIAVRTYFMDQKIMEAIQQGVRQIVILAAGMDTRAYRMSLPADTQIFELDRKEVLNYKQEILLQSKPTCQRHVLMVDLRDDWKKQLLHTEFLSSKPTLWLVEGLLMYLNESDVLQLFEKINSLARPKDILLLDIFSQALLDAPHMKKQLQFLENIGASWRFGIKEEPEVFMQQLGWSAEATQPGEFFPSRWPFPVTPRNIPNVPRSYFIKAIKSV